MAVIIQTSSGLEGRIAMTGDWDRFQLGLRSLTVGKTKRQFKAILNQFAKAYMIILKKQITDIREPAHSDATRAKYGQHPLLRLSRQYFKAIQMRPGEDKHGFFVKVGVFGDQIHVNSDGYSMRMTQLAHILEFGNPRNLAFGRVLAPIPPRPHFRPAWAKFVGRGMKQKWKSRSRQAFKNILRGRITEVS